MLFSVGCELGGSDKGEEWACGGYIHLLARDYSRKSEAHYRKFRDGVFWDLREASGGDHWVVEASLVPVRVLLDGGDVDAPWIILNVHAIAASEAGAIVLKTIDRRVGGMPVRQGAPVLRPRVLILAVADNFQFQSAGSVSASGGAAARAVSVMA